MSGNLDLHLFEQLSARLADQRDYWQPTVFADDPPWVRQQPKLTEQLLQLDDAGLERLEQDPAALSQWLDPWLSDSLDLDRLIAPVVEAPLPAPLALAEKHGRDIKGRKWQQILHFAASVQLTESEQPPLLAEWCAGKAHLGRLLARQQPCRLRSIECQQRLCEEARSLAQRDRVQLEAIQADVLKQPAAELLHNADHVIALHACGDLHRTLLQALPDQTTTRSADIAPCCYHMSRDEQYRPLSESAQRAGLELNRYDLRLVGQQVVVAGATEVARSRELMRWRLGFDWLQRQWRGYNQYLPCPSVPQRVLRQGFEPFVASMAEHHGIERPARIDYQAALTVGAHRLERSRRLSLVRHRFRRALECWLLLDRAAFLEEAGFDVRVGRFCPFHITPRNLIIQARR